MPPWVRCVRGDARSMDTDKRCMLERVGLADQGPRSGPLEPCTCDRLAPCRREPGACEGRVDAHPLVVQDRRRKESLMSSSVGQMAPSSATRSGGFERRLVVCVERESNASRACGAPSPWIPRAVRRTTGAKSFGFVQTGTRRPLPGSGRPSGVDGGSMRFRRQQGVSSTCFNVAAQDSPMKQRTGSRRRRFIEAPRQSGPPPARRPAAAARWMRRVASHRSGPATGADRRCARR